MCRTYFRTEHVTESLPVTSLPVAPHSTSANVTLSVRYYPYTTYAQWRIQQKTMITICCRFPLGVHMPNRKLRNTHGSRRSRDPFGSVLGVFSTTSASYNHRKLPPLYFHIMHHENRGIRRTYFRPHDSRHFRSKGPTRADIAQLPVAHVQNILPDRARAIGGVTIS
jgi:hypothetical protein